MEVGGYSCLDFFNFISKNNNFLFFYRKAALRPLTILSLIFLAIPLCINLFLGNWGLVLVTITMSLTLVLLLIAKGHIEKITSRIFYFAIYLWLTGVFLSAKDNSIDILYWNYPFIIFMFLIVSVRTAIFGSLFSLVVSAVIMYPNLKTTEFVYYLITSVLLVFIFLVVFYFIDRLSIQDKYYAFHDGLTSVYNRRKMDIDIASIIEKDTIDSLSIAILDIDDFKLCNDRFGHDFGDKVLIKFTQYLMCHLPLDCSLYRMGGEEFLVLSKNRDASSMHHILSSIQSSITELMNSEGFYFSFSAGIASLEDVQSDNSQLTIANWLRNADIALYAVKSNGKNGILKYTQELR